MAQRTETASCGWLRHDWDGGHDAADDFNPGCNSYTIRYTCRTCGKIKDRGGA